jgi:hypothetical protein
MSTSGPDRTYRSSTKGAVASGGTTFAGIMLATVSGFGFLQGIAAIASDEVFVTGIAYTYELDVTAWGWIHVMLGVVGLLTGIGLVMGQAWAMLVGVAIALLSAVANFAFMPYYPYWSLAVIAFDVFVIWALCQELAHADAV